MVSNAFDFSEIDNFLFDLGGVLIDIDPNKTIEAFSQLGLPNLHEQINHGHHSGLFKQLEKGQISSTEFINAIHGQLPTKVSNGVIIDAWNSMLIHFPIERINILKRLRKVKPVYLLSNTNGIHHDCFVNMAGGLNTFNSLFTKVFYSNLLGCSKPDVEPFDMVIKEVGLVPKRTLFLDDLLANVETAKKLGFKTVHVSPINSVEKIFRNM